MAKSLETIARETFKESEECMNDRINTAFDSVDSILEQGSATLKELVEAKDDAEKCLENNSAWDASTCIASVS